MATTTVSATVTQGVNLTRTYQDYPGGSTTRVQQSDPGLQGLSFSAATTPAATKAWSKAMQLAATPTTLDLTSLDGSYGDTSFSKVFVLSVANLTSTSGYIVTVGAAASQAFTGPLGGTAPTIAVAPSMTQTLATTATAGWTTSSKNNLKLDPGANTVNVVVSIIGA